MASVAAGGAGVAESGNVRQLATKNQPIFVERAFTRRRAPVTDPFNAANAGAIEIPNVSIPIVLEKFMEAVRDGDKEKGTDALTKMYKIYKRSVDPVFFTKLFVLICKEQMKLQLENETTPSHMHVQKARSLIFFASFLCTNRFHLDQDPLAGDDKTPLMYACLANIERAFYLLLLRGFDHTKKDDAGNTALDLCDGSLPHMQAALRAKDPISYAAGVEIQYIIKSKEDEASATAFVIKLLPLADLTIPDYEGYTPLLGACATAGRTNVALEIIKRSSHLNLNAINYMNGETALIRAASTNNIKVVDELIRKGVRLNITDTRNRCALLFAINQKNPTIALMLIAAGADLRPAIKYMKVEDDDSDSNFSLNPDIRGILTMEGDARASAAALLLGKYKPPEPAPVPAPAAAANEENAEGGRRRSRKRSNKLRRSRKL
jgi:ankyrin repeat protein